MANLVPDVGIGFPHGMHDSAAPTGQPEGTCTLAINVRIAADTLLETLGGSQRTHTAALNSGAQCYGETGFRTAADAKQLCAVFGDTFYFSADDGKSWTSPSGATGLDLAYWSFASIADASGTVYLCATNGGGLFTWDGATWAAVVGAPTGVLYLATFNSRLWASDGQNAYASAVRDPTTWTSPPGIVVPVQTHDGDPVTGLYVVGALLLVFKANSTAYISGYGNADVSVQTGPVGISRSVGCIAPRSICAIGNSEAAWLSAQGVAIYSGGSVTVVTNDNLRQFWRSVSLDIIAATPGLPCAIYEPARHEYTVSLPVGLERNNYDIILNTATNGPTLGRRFGDTGSALALDADGYLRVVPAAQGRVARLENGYLRIAETWQLGAYVSLDADNVLRLTSAAYDPAALCLADTAARPDVAFSGGYDGFVRELEAADGDDTLADGTGGTPVDTLVIDRPRFAAVAFEPKQLRKIEALVAADEASTVTLSGRGDGTEGAQHAVAVAAAVAGRPQWVHAHVNVRGRTLEAVFRSTAARMRVGGFRVWAQILQRRT